MISVPSDTFTLATANLYVTLLKENGIKIHHLGMSCKLTVTEQTVGKSKFCVHVYGFSIGVRLNACPAEPCILTWSLTSIWLTHSPHAEVGEKKIREECSSRFYLTILKHLTNNN